MKTKIISFYCDINDNTYYSDCAKKLENSCKNFNVNYCIEKLESSNNWMLNCLKKPKFILNKLQQYKCPLIWLDVDTIFKNPFIEFDDCEFDIGLVNPYADITGIKASPIFINYTTNSIKFVTDWMNICEHAIKNNLIELDHDALRYSIVPLYINKNDFKMQIVSNKYYEEKYLHNIESPYELKPKMIYDKITQINNQRKIKMIYDKITQINNQKKIK